MRLPARAEWAVDASPLEPFQRGRLWCYRRIFPWGELGDNMLAWVAGDSLGCTTFTVVRIPIRLPGAAVTDAAGVHWQPIVLAAHALTPPDGDDEDEGNSGCVYLDRMTCWGRASGVDALELFSWLCGFRGEWPDEFRVAAPELDENFIWATLALWHVLYVRREQPGTEEEITAMLREVNIG